MQDILNLHIGCITDAERSEGIIENNRHCIVKKAFSKDEDIELKHLPFPFSASFTYMSVYVDLLKYTYGRNRVYSRDYCRERSHNRQSKIVPVRIENILNGHYAYC